MATVWQQVGRVLGEQIRKKKDPFNGAQPTGDKLPAPATPAGAGVATIDQRYSQNYNKPSFGMGQELYKNFANTIGPPPVVNELPQTYFDNQKATLKEQLRNEFFGGGGRFEGALNQESAAGRLGSPVAQAILQQTVTDPYMKASTQIDRDVLGAQLEDRRKAQELSGTFKAQYADLTNRAAMAERGVLSQEQISQLDADLRAYEAILDYRGESEKTQASIQEALMNDYRKGQELSLQYLQTPLIYDETTAGVYDQVSSGLGGGAGGKQQAGGLPPPPAGQSNYVSDAYGTRYTPYGQTGKYSGGLPPNPVYGQVHTLPNGMTVTYYGSRGWVQTGGNAYRR